VKRRAGRLAEREQEGSVRKEKRFTIAEHKSGGFYMKDGGNTMEDLEVEAERLNLLDRIADALESLAGSVANIEGRS
jgi:hypothetical protein